jgi:hypothetical protein
MVETTTNCFLVRLSIRVNVESFINDKCISYLGLKMSLHIPSADEFLYGRPTYQIT